MSPVKFIDPTRPPIAPNSNVRTSIRTTPPNDAIGPLSISARAVLSANPVRRPDPATATSRADQVARPRAHKPLADVGSAVLSKDLIDPEANVKQLAGPLTGLLQNDTQRQNMARTLRQTRPPNGAETIAEWIRSTLG